MHIEFTADNGRTGLRRKKLRRPQILKFLLSVFKAFLLNVFKVFLLRVSKALLVRVFKASRLLYKYIPNYEVKRIPAFLRLPCAPIMRRGFGRGSRRARGFW